MGGIEVLVLLGLLLAAGQRGVRASSPPSTPVPTPSVPTPGPPVQTRTPPVATAPPAGQPSTPQQARTATASARVPPPWPQAVPAGLPAFPGPGWKPWSPPPASVVARANQLLPELWKFGAGTRKVEQTSGQWTTYLATAMGANGQIKGVTAHRLVATPGQLPNA